MKNCGRRCRLSANLTVGTGSGAAASDWLMTLVCCEVDAGDTGGFPSSLSSLLVTAFTSELVAFSFGIDFVVLRVLNTVLMTPIYLIANTLVEFCRK